MADYVSLSGTTVGSAELKIAKAQDLAYALEAGEIEYSKLVQCMASDWAETIIVDVEVELGQKRAYPICSVERIAIRFYEGDELMPEVLALREDFPLVPHVNARKKEIPRSLCIYDRPYVELKLQWTSQRFISDIRSWLARTAKGKLHEENQTLEPLLMGGEGKIVLPFNILTKTESDLQKLIIKTMRVKPHLVFVANFENENVFLDNTDLPFALSILKCPPQEHGIIRQMPQTIAELADFLKGACDFIPFLRQEILRLEPSDQSTRAKFLESRLVMVVCFPKTRKQGGEIEINEKWAFVSIKTIKDIGVDIGLWLEFEGEVGRILGEIPADKNGSNIEIGALEPVFKINADIAAYVSGLDSVKKTKIVGIGTGALGSQVVMNLARSAYGYWTLIDNDDFLPHNSIRHSLDGFAIGHSKAKIVSHIANSILDDENRFSFIDADVLKPGNHEQEMQVAFSASEIILDMSASVAVARSLSNDESTSARRISVFMNPTGKDLVLLAEDPNRNIPLDALEMQYYRALTAREDLKEHFLPSDGRHRYGQGCRDVTSRIGQENVALHAAIGSMAVREIVDDSEARICIWRTKDDLTVTKINIAPTDITRFKVGEWDLIVDRALIEKIQHLRTERLPNETGGVLVGSFDLQRKIAYVVDTIISPPDSEEWPTLYIRGCKGLKKTIEEIVEQTDGALQYVGEWHSHPDGCSTLPSSDDMKVFSWLTDRMHADGFPALMMIAGQENNVNCFIGEMKREENLIPIDLT